MQTLIVGGGLSGLALADALETQGADYLLIEARDRFGGRIKTERLEEGRFDMGPAWFWPGQPRIASVIQRLGLTSFEQYSEGALTFEDECGQVRRGRGFASMQGSLRLSGGIASLTQALEDRLPAARKRTNAALVKLLHESDRITATLGTGETISADRVVLALPPRVAAVVSFTPALPQTAMLAMEGVATWMAGQAKAVVVYSTPFWREDGLSGDAQSRYGPMVEIHDASPARGGPYALFGFIGLPPQGRRDEGRLRKSICAQLERLFGPAAATPLELYVKDWAIDPYTSTELDKAPLYAHPTYRMPPALTDIWGGRLFFAGTEVAPEFGGYLEGALAAAEATLEALARQG